MVSGLVFQGCFEELVAHQELTCFRQLLFVTRYRNPNSKQYHSCPLSIMHSTTMWHPCLVAAWSQGGLLETPPRWHATIWWCVHYQYLDSRTEKNENSTIIFTSNFTILLQLCAQGRFKILLFSNTFTKTYSQYTSTDSIVFIETILWIIFPFYSMFNIKTILIIANVHIFNHL